MVLPAGTRLCTSVAHGISVIGAFKAAAAAVMRSRTGAGVGAGGGGWLTRNVAAPAGVSFLQDAASELLYPILPIFLTVQLGAPVAVVGAIEGVAEGAASITKVLAGRISDGRRRRPLITLGYGAA